MRFPLSDYLSLFLANVDFKTASSLCLARGSTSQGRAQKNERAETSGQLAFFPLDFRAKETVRSLVDCYQFFIYARFNVQLEKCRA